MNSDPDNVLAVIDFLQEELPRGAEKLVYVRSFCFLASIIADTIKSDEGEVLSFDCPTDAASQLKKHEAFRGKANKITLVPLDEEGYGKFLQLLDGDYDFQLFLFDEGGGWRREKNVRVAFSRALEEI